MIASEINEVIQNNDSIKKFKDIIAVFLCEHNDEDDLFGPIFNLSFAISNINKDINVNTTFDFNNESPTKIIDILLINDTEKHLLQIKEPSRLLVKLNIITHLNLLHHFLLII